MSCECGSAVVVSDRCQLDSRSIAHRNINVVEQILLKHKERYRPRKSDDVDNRCLHETHPSVF